MKRLNSRLQQDGAPLELILLIRTLLAGCKEISFRVSQAHLGGLLGSTLDENIQGEVQKKLDVISNQLLKDMLLDDDTVRSIASEEEDLDEEIDLSVNTLLERRTPFKHISEPRRIFVIIHTSVKIS